MILMISRHRHAERLREVLDGDARLDGDRAGRRRDLARLLRPRARRRARGAWRLSWRGRAAPVSMTTRRLRRPGRRPLAGRIGRFGLFGPLAMSRVSVEPRELGIDPHGRSQDRLKALRSARPLEAGEPPARVDAPARRLRRGSSTPSRATKRSSSACGAFRPQPAHVRIGSAHAAGSALLSTSLGTGRPAARRPARPATSPSASATPRVGLGDVARGASLWSSSSRSSATLSADALGLGPARRRGLELGLGSLDHRLLVLGSRARAPGGPGRRSSASPGSAAFGQRLPFERIAAQRPVNSSLRRRRRRRPPRPPPARTRCRTGCRPSSPSGARRGGRSGPPCRSRARAGRRGRRRSPRGARRRCRPRARARARAPWRRSARARGSTG